MPSEPIFDTMSPIQMDNKTGRIAMMIGVWHDESDPLPHLGKSRTEAEEIAKAEMWKHVFPKFRGGYMVVWSGLSESQRLIIAICEPNKGKGPVPQETIDWCEENSILGSNIPELG